MADPAPNAVANARVPIPAISLSPVSLDRLKKAMVAVQYYAMIARPINLNNLNVATVNAIDAAFETMKTKKPEKRSNVPKYMPKSMSTSSWNIFPKYVDLGGFLLSCAQGRMKYQSQTLHHSFITDHILMNLVRS